MTERKYTREDCIRLLAGQHEILASQGLSRYPQRSDFAEAEVVAIKAFLGPWPRALEAAGIKPPRQDDRTERTREKRIRSKQRRSAARRAAQSAHDTQEDTR